MRYSTDRDHSYHVGSESRTTGPLHTSRRQCAAIGEDMLLRAVLPVLFLCSLAAAAQPAPTLVPARRRHAARQHQLMPPSPSWRQQQPAAGAIDIGTLINISQAADTDVSAVLDAIAAQSPAGRTVVFPGPASFLLSPLGRSNWTLPPALVLQLGGGAVLKAAPLLRIYMGGEVVAAPGQRIFEVLSLSLSLCLSLALSLALALALSLSFSLSLSLADTIIHPGAGWDGVRHAAS